jgi:2-amino-4-hydroxy-6-hydroxymethyldihydropteridine diphosphokinase
MMSRFASIATGVTMREVVLGLGSNIGDSAAILQGAVRDISAAEGLVVTNVSAVFETDPVGGPEQRAFLNAVVLAETTLLNHELLATVQAVEQHWLRTREVHWGPRTLDIDIVAVGDEVYEDPDLTIPHALAHERAFVLVPWADVDPDAWLVGHGLVVDLLAVMDDSGVRRTSILLEAPQAEPED